MRTAAERSLSPRSDIGSIGMTMSYLDHSAKDAEEGLRYVSLTSATFKDYGNPDRPLTSAEHALLEREEVVFCE